MYLMIDNYDSFTYNLYQFIGIFNSDIKVVRNDKITIEEIEELDLWKNSLQRPVAVCVFQRGNKIKVVDLLVIDFDN